MPNWLIDALRDAGGTLIVIAIVTFFSWWFSDVLVDDFVTPLVVKDLKKDSYINQKIKEGKFVSTDKASFHENYIIPSDNLIDLKNGNYLERDDTKIKSIEHRIDINFDTLIDKLNQLEKAQVTIEGHLDIVRAKVDELIEVKLFISTREADKGYMILNKNNPVISTLVDNNKSYYISDNKNEGGIPFQLRLQNTSAAGYEKDAPIGRLHEEDYHRLFTGSNPSSGLGTAYIHLKNSNGNTSN